MTVAIRPGPTVELFDSVQSKRSFAFFRLRTSPQLSGFFKLEFWETVVFRVAHHEPAIRHAIVALGAVHEATEHRSSSPSAIRTFAMEQYNLAIRELLAPLVQRGERAVDVCLISCIIFANFECLRGCHAAAMAHIQSGSKLLHEAVYDPRTGELRHAVLGTKSRADSYVLLDVIARIFIWLDGESGSAIRDHDYAAYEGLFSPDATDEELVFQNVEEARSTFEYGVCVYNSGASPAIMGDPLESAAVVQAHREYYTKLLSRFTVSLQQLVDSQRGHFTPKEDLAVTVLQLNAISFFVSFHLDYLPPDRRYRWEDLMPYFEKLVIRGEKIVTCMALDEDFGGGMTTSFCQDVGFVIPLFKVASQCRDPILRRRAIAVLRSVSRQEGVWNSLITAQAAERIMELEEQGYVVTALQDNGPSELGAPKAWPLLRLDGRGARLEYIRKGHMDEAPVEVVEELCEWESADILSK
ncbi:hypothetical protein LQW54_001382 [Pestalotiopsis sp. IQ-011]